MGELLGSFDRADKLMSYAILLFVIEFTSGYHLKAGGAGRYVSAR